MKIPKHYSGPQWDSPRKNQNEMARFKAGETIRHKVTGQEFYIKSVGHHYRMVLVGDQGDGGLANIPETDKYFEKKEYNRKKFKF